MRHSLVKVQGLVSYEKLMSGDYILDSFENKETEEMSVLFYSEWDELSKNLIKSITETNVKNPKLILLYSTFEFPELFGLNNEIGVPCLITPVKNRHPMIEDYPSRIWYHLGLY